MKSFVLHLLAVTSFVCLPGFLLADETDGDEKEAKVTYKHDYSDQDLSNRDFSGKNLDNSNFENANLTYIPVE